MGDNTIQKKKTQPIRKIENREEAVNQDSPCLPKQKTRFIPKPEVLHRIGRSNSALYQMISGGLFPSPYHPHGCRTSLWLESDVDNWIAARLAEAGKGVAA